MASETKVLEAAKSRLHAVPEIKTQLDEKVPQINTPLRGPTLSDADARQAARRDHPATGALRTTVTGDNTLLVPAPNPKLIRYLALYASEVVLCGRNVASLGAFITHNVATKLELQKSIRKLSPQASAQPQPRISWFNNGHVANVFVTGGCSVECIVMLLRNGTPFAVALQMFYHNRKWRASQITVM